MRLVWTLRSVYLSEMHQGLPKQKKPWAVSVVRDNQMRVLNMLRQETSMILMGTNFAFQQDLLAFMVL